MASIMEGWFGELALVRFVVQRGLACIYAIAFLSAWNQFPALLGERGLLPVPDFLARIPFRSAPSLFYAGYSDRRFRLVAGLGLALSCVALSGVSESHGELVSLSVWLGLYVLYLSIVNVGQTFYAFGWESMLLEAGFFAAFLGPAREEPSIVPILALRFMLFRVELGAGLIKLRHDSCWRDLTCLEFHHETQPMPNPLSRFAHRLPKRALHAGVALSHFVQVAVPFALFLPQPVASVAGALILGHQLLLIAFGNYAWLNWLTIVLSFSAFEDATIGALVPAELARLLSHHGTPRSIVFEGILVLLAMATVGLGLLPLRDLASKEQKMNATYNPLHLVSSYGAFGSVTRIRFEVVLEGTRDAPDDEGARWIPYGFRGKPGDPDRLPPQVAPYHLRLDWAMWFLPFSVLKMGERIVVTRRERWFMKLVEHLLDADPATRALLRDDPFGDEAPRAIRARFVRYSFATSKESRASGRVWDCVDLGFYLRPTDRDDLSP